MKTLSPLPVVLLGGLLVSACASVPPPLVAYPGPNKTAEAMQQDDIACRQQAAAQPASPAGAPAQQPVAASNDSYFTCMAARGNTVAAAPAAPPVAYPAYAYDGGVGLWADPFWYSYYGVPTYPYVRGGLGFYGGWGGPVWRGRYPGWRGGYHGPFRGGPGAGRGFGGRGFRGR